LYCARPSPASLFRALTGHPLARAKIKTQEAGEDGNWPAGARPNRSRRLPPALPRPTGGLFPRIRSVIPRPPVGRASRLTKHRIGRVWGRSLRCRSLGLATASAVTGSVSTGVLPSPCFAWGLRITALRPAWAGLRKLSRQG